MGSITYINRKTPTNSAMERLLQDMYPPGIDVEFIPFDEVIVLDESTLPVEGSNDPCEGRR